MTKTDLRIVFMGTPEFAVANLRGLVEGGYNVVAVVTQPDKPVGRHQDKLQPTKVKEYALEHGLPVLQPVKMKDPEFIEQLKSYNADLQVVTAFRILPEMVWDMPKYGTFNVHASLLPRYRGASPINAAIINGDEETGVTTFFLDHDIDTGKIIHQEKYAIDADANFEQVYNDLAVLGTQVMLQTVDDIIKYGEEIPAMDQPATELEEKYLYAHKINKEDCEIDWKKSAKEVHDFVRGLYDRGTWTTVTDGSNEQIMKIWATKIGPETELPAGKFFRDKKHLYVATGKGSVELTEVQPAGKKRMQGIAFMNGVRDVDALKTLPNLPSRGEES